MLRRDSAGIPPTLSNDDADHAAPVQRPIYLTELTSSIGHLEALSRLHPDDGELNAWRTEAAAAQTELSELSELTIATVRETSRRGGIDSDIKNAEQLHERMTELSASLKTVFESRVPEVQRRSYWEWDGVTRELHNAMSHLHTAVLSLSIELDDLRKSPGVAFVVMDGSGQYGETCPEGLPEGLLEGNGSNENSTDGGVGDREQMVGTSILNSDA